MKFICDRTALLKEIGIAQDIIPSGSSSAITVLSNIYLEARAGRLLIKATDINVYYETSVPVSVVEEGATMVFGSKLFVFLQSLPSNSGTVLKLGHGNILLCPLQFIIYTTVFYAEDKGEM